MAVVFMEGFDLYNGVGTGTGLQTRWVYFNGSAGVGSSMVTGRFGGQALRLSPQIGYYLARATLPSTLSALSVGVAIRVSTLAASQTLLWLTLNDASQVCIATTTNGSIQAFRGDIGAASRYGSQLLGVSADGVVFANTWHYLELSTSIHDSTGTVTIKLDGAAVLTLTGQDTKAQSGAGVNGVLVGSSGGGATVDFDDLYVTDSTTGLGERRIETLRPSADTATADWTPNTGAVGYTQVDEATADGDATYIQSGGIGDHSLFELSDLATSPTSIDAVQPVLFARKTDAATRQLALSVESAGTGDDGTAVNLAADYNAFRRILETDPHDAAAWTKAKVDALKAGPKVAA